MRVRLPPRPLMEKRITPIYEDRNFLAINKPAGLLVHPAKAESYKLKTEPTLVDWLLENYPEVKNVGDNPKIRPGIVHRLDKNTSGVILIAKNQKYFEYLKNLFQNHQIKKTYLALVWGKVDPVRNGVSNGVEPKIGVIAKAIRLKSGSIKRTVWQGKMEKEAITEFRVIKFVKLKVNKDKEQIFSLLRLIPKTGRTHQIRVHLASIGHPVVGDSLYGKKDNPWGLKRLFLHAESLEFNLRDGRRIKIEADLPKELKGFLQIFGAKGKTKFA